MTRSMEPSRRLNPDASRPGNDVPVTPTGETPAPPSDADEVGVGRPTVTIAVYLDYASAQRAVDFLSDNGFPVEHTAIVGTDLRLVERVLGRMTTARAALAGAASGAWFGLFIGLLFAIFSVSAWWRVLLAGLLIGAVWGAAFGAIAHAATGGRRDFTSRSFLQAGQYAVNADAAHAEQARQLLTRLTWRANNP